MAYSGSVIQRKGHLGELQRLLKSFPVVAIVGARQTGKTTLARMLSAARRGPVRHFDLEDPRDLGQLADPMLALEGLRGLIVLDEIHRRPEIFPVLRVLADRRPIRARFLVLGSASPDLLRQGSESLAGRIAYYFLPGLSLEEVGPDKLDRLWLRGRFPRAFLAKTLSGSSEWRHNFIQMFLERDIPSFGFSLPAETLYRFWAMLAHYHGQLWNGSEFARSFGVSDPTVRRYLDLLTSTFVVRQLPPWPKTSESDRSSHPRSTLRIVAYCTISWTSSRVEISSATRRSEHLGRASCWKTLFRNSVSSVSSVSSGRPIPGPSSTSSFMLGVKGGVSSSNERRPQK